VHEESWRVGPSALGTVRDTYAVCPCVTNDEAADIALFSDVSVGVPNDIDRMPTSNQQGLASGGVPFSLHVVCGLERTNATFDIMIHSLKGTWYTLCSLGVASVRWTILFIAR